jgi:hypothetical protein
MRKKNQTRTAVAGQSYTYKFALRWLGADGGAKNHTPPPPHVAAQFEAYGRHYNNRIEISRDARVAYREARTALVPEWAAAEATLTAAQTALDTVYTEAQNYKAALRTKKLPPELRGRLEAARTARTEARKAFTLAKENVQMSESLAARALEINASRSTREKEVRAKTPLYWGSYLRAEEAAEKAAKTASDLPEFKRWYTGLPVPEMKRSEALGSSAPYSSQSRIPEGTIAVQIQSTRPLTVATLYGDDTRAQLRRDGKYTRGRIRIGSNGKDPIWGEFSTHIDREMPADARVTWVWIRRERIGAKYRHWLYVGVERGMPAPSVATGALAVDVNMRVVDGGLRVAVTYDGEGFREWVLPQKIADKTYHAHEIQSTRDQNFNEAKVRLAAFVKERSEALGSSGESDSSGESQAGSERSEALGSSAAGQSGIERSEALGSSEVLNISLPPWLTEATPHIAAWRDHGRLAALVIAWRDQRFPGDEAIYQDLEGWRKHDRHLLEYGTHEADGARGMRLNLYRHWAAEWTRSAATIVLPDYDWAEMALTPWPGDEDVPAAVRKRRHNIVAPDTLAYVVRAAARSRGVTVLKAKPVVVCASCGGVVEEDKVAGRVLCSKCGGGSRDEAQALSLYGQRERSSGDDGTGGARDRKDGDIAGDLTGAVGPHETVGLRDGDTLAE